jgi:mRNA-degrading endonuclease YafQ of YafQ-DinJ toxin-antitoxin module
MLELVTTQQLERDLKTLTKRSKKLGKLWSIVELLLTE